MSKLTPQQKLQIMRDLEVSSSLGITRALALFDDLLSKYISDSEQQFKSVVDKMKSEIQSMQLKDGYTPRKFVDYFTPQEIQQIIKSATPVNGKDYLTPEEVSATQEMITSKVFAMIQVRDGVTPQAGIDYPTFDQIKDMVTKLFIELENKEDVAETGDELVSGIEKGFSAVQMTGEDIIKSINSLPLDAQYQIPASRIIGLPRLRGKNGKYMHGGGDTVLAGSGITIVTNSDGSKTLSSSGSSGSGYQSPTGAVNGSNTVFVFSTAPSAIVVDGVNRRKTQSDGTANWSGTTTITLLTSIPTYDIYAVA